jgi:triosephosphate isomerase
MFDAKIAGSVKILYGGSMKPDSARELLSENDIDGGLIGGASMNAKTFAEIVKVAHELSS